MVKMGVIKVLLLSVFISACAGGQPTPTPDFATYSDEQGAFRISYPSYWEPALSMMPLPEFTRAALKDVLSGEQVETVSMLFFGGESTTEGFYPNISVVVGPAQGLVDEFVEATVFEPPADDYQELSRVRTVIDGREAFILESRLTIPDTPGPVAILQMMTVEGGTGWVVTCGTRGEFAEIRPTCDQAVRSLRILPE